MTADIVSYPGVTRLDCAPENTIKCAVEAKLKDVVIIGFDEDGEFFFASNKADGGDALWLLELARKRLMEAGDP